MEDNSRIGGGIQSNLSGSHPTVVGMRSRICTKSLKLLGAGGGNRTLVFSLEGFRQLNTIKGHSEKWCQNRLLITNTFFVPSERPQKKRKSRVRSQWRSRGYDHGRNSRPSLSPTRLAVLPLLVIASPDPERPNT